jgi:hypothetical protein
MADPGAVDTELYRHAGRVLRTVKRFLGWLVFKVSTGATPDAV